METCGLCEYEISDPRCMGCLKKNALDFLRNRPHLNKEVEAAIEKFEKEESNGTRCIFCNSKVKVCDYCFYSYIQKRLQEKNIAVSEEFNRIFKQNIIPVFQSLC
jgi:hypothetical protein